MKGKLTPKQERFCQLYTVYWEATRAAREAKYSEKSASRIGHELVKNPLVKARIDELKEHALAEIGVSRERVLSELASVAMADATDAFDDQGGLKSFKEMPKNVRKAIAGLEVTELFDGRGEDKTAIGLLKKIKFWDKNRALELLGKHLKLYADRVEHSGPDGKPIEHKDLTALPDEQLDAKIQAMLAKQGGGECSSG